jgi:hypothetical protein
MSDAVTTAVAALTVPAVPLPLQVGFLAVCGAVLLAWWLLLRHALGTRSAVVGLTLVTLWLTLLASLGHAGVLVPDADTMPPLMARLLLGAGLALVAFALSQRGRQLAHGVPLWSLLLLQSFRLPLELVMAGLGNAGALPVQMTLHGWNFDIVSGVLGLGLGLLALRRTLPVAVVVASQVVSLGLLVTIVFVAVRSLPGPTAGWPELPRNTLVLFDFWTWLPGLLVLSALLGHLLVAVRLGKSRPLE